MQEPDLARVAAKAILLYPASSELRKPAGGILEAGPGIIDERGTCLITRTTFSSQYVLKRNAVLLSTFYRQYDCTRSVDRGKEVSSLFYCSTDPQSARLWRG